MSEHHLENLTRPISFYSLGCLLSENNWPQREKMSHGVGLAAILDLSLPNTRFYQKQKTNIILAIKYLLGKQKSWFNMFRRLLNSIKVVLKIFNSCKWVKFNMAAKNFDRFSKNNDISIVSVVPICLI